MSKHKTPQQKKADRYTKDHITPSEYPHSFRKAWPKKKAKANRAYRTRINELTKMAPHFTDNEDVDNELKNVYRKKVKKWPVIPLKERIHLKQNKRVSFTGYNFFKKQTYSSCPASEKGQFKHFLSETISEKGDYAKRIALFFHNALNAPKNHLEDNAHRYLNDFFEYEPEWEVPVKTWIHKNLCG